jgi:hypothetical protein
MRVQVQGGASAPPVIAICAMQTSSQAAEEAEALAFLGPAVLMNGLIFAALWANLGDRGDKMSLRRVCHTVRVMVDSYVTALDMPVGDSTQLSTALTLWPGLTCLTVSGTAACLSVLPAAQLARLQKLSLRNAVRHAFTYVRTMQHTCMPC